MTAKMKLNLICAACGPELGIGLNNDLPWRLKEEMNYFNRMTIGDGSSKRHAIVMGRKTWISNPEAIRPLERRLNVVLSRREGYNPKEEVGPGGNKDDVIVCKSLEDAVKTLSGYPDINDIVWIIGGSAVYKDAMESDLCHRIYLTQIDQNYPCDVFFPKIDFGKFEPVSDPEVPQEQQREGDVTYKFKIYQKN